MGRYQNTNDPPGAASPDSSRSVSEQQPNGDEVQSSPWTSVILTHGAARCRSVMNGAQGDLL